MFIRHQDANNMFSENHKKFQKLYLMQTSSQQFLKTLALGNTTTV